MKVPSHEEGLAEPERTSSGAEQNLRAKDLKQDWQELNRLHDARLQHMRDEVHMTDHRAGRSTSSYQRFDALHQQGLNLHPTIS